MAVRLIHIAPELPPTVGGVADYSTILSRRLAEESDGSVEPILIHAGKAPTEAIEVDFPTVDLSGTQSAATIADTVQNLSDEADRPAVVMLEYSGYGYAKRGAPLWLARGLARVCGDDGVPLITMFHEISASGPVWTSAFWFSPLQTYAARRLARLSSGIMTTHPTGTDEFRGVGEDSSIQVCPVFSNVGEPKSRPSFRERAAQAVVFGGGQTKTALYGPHRSVMQAGLEEWAIDTVIDVGPPDAVQSEALETEVEVRGFQPAEAISDVLLDARIGLLHYPAAYATKSGILAAYMAHGTVPVLVAPEPLGGRLEAGTHFAVPKNNKTQEGPRIARAAASWYDRHAHSQHAAQTVLDLMKPAIDSPVVRSTPQ